MNRRQAEALVGSVEIIADTETTIGKLLDEKLECGSGGFEWRDSYRDFHGNPKRHKTTWRVFKEARCAKGEYWVKCAKCGANTCIKVEQPEGAR